LITLHKLKNQQMGRLQTLCQVSWGVGIQILDLTTFRAVMRLRKWNLRKWANFGLWGQLKGTYLVPRFCKVVGHKLWSKSKVPWQF
jgi:hypothetical protein